jgi:hypothetical protein
MAKMTRTISVAIPMAIALLPKPNLGFAPAQSRFLSVEPALSKTVTATRDRGSSSRNFALSAKDTIFSLNEDDETDVGEEVDSEDIEELISSIMADEKAADSSDDVSAEESGNKKRIGDPLREDNGVRPSIHPTTINAIAEALKARAAQSVKAKKAGKGNDEDAMYFRVSEGVEPVMVMVTAGQFASDAIQKRQESSTEDGMLLDQAEEQTLAGRVMGVVMRLDDLEAELAERTAAVSWVGQYGEWGNFGVLEGEHKPEGSDGNDNDDDGLGEVHAKILDDPLFCMNRAECLLAIFLQEVEIPQLEKLKETVPDGSKIDFLDEDRREVVLKSE